MKIVHFAHVWRKPGMTPHQRYEQLWREFHRASLVRKRKRRPLSFWNLPISAQTVYNAAQFAVQNAICLQESEVPRL
jgi:hypothetical protein